MLWIDELGLNLLMGRTTTQNILKVLLSC